MITKQMVSAAQRGQEEARAEIAQTCQTAFLRALRRRRVDAEAAQDLSQQALEIVMRKLPEFQWRAQFESWALAILFNCHLRYLQKQKLNGERIAEQPVEAEPIVDRVADRPGNDPFWQVYRRDLCQALADCLSHVNLVMHEVWVQHRLQGREYHVIAEQMGLNINTVSTRIFRVDGRMRKCLEEKSYTPATLAVAGSTA